MQMRLSLLFILLLTECFGQMFVNKNGEQLAENVVFDTNFIRINKIKSINGRFSFKKNGSEMRESNFWQVFKFDTLGRITQSFETRKDDGSTDTVWNTYFYNDKGLQIYHSKGYKEFFNYTTTVYDSLKRIVMIEEFQRKPDLYGIPITKEAHVERYSYTEKGGKIIKTRMNKNGTPYATITPFYNDNGQMIREEDRYISTNEGTISHFEYDDIGNVLKKRVLTSKQGLEKELIAFKYDKNGKLIEKKKFTENTLKLEIQIIPSESNGFLSALLLQEGNNNSIVILRIKEYERY